MSLSSSCSVMGASGFLRSWLWLVVKPFTSSPGDADDDLGRVDAGRALRLAQRRPAVLDHALDIGDRRRLHVTQALPGPSGAGHDARAVLDAEHERLDVLGADVQRCGHGRPLAVLAAPDATQDGHRRQPASAVSAATVADAPLHRASQRRRPRPRRAPSATPCLPVTLALGHLRPAAATPVDGGHRGGDESCGGGPARDEVLADGDPDLRQLVIHHERDDARAQDAVDVLGVRLQLLHRGERRRQADEWHAADRVARTPPSSAGRGRPPAAAPARSRFSSSRTRACSSSTRAGSASAVWAPAARPRHARGSRSGCP